MDFGFGKQRKFKNKSPPDKCWLFYNNRNISLHEGTSTIRHKCIDPVKIAK